jgi:tRNA A-37 threonylcarbamoyl transferase component Bud32
MHNHDHAVPLTGGNASGEVVRIGDTVHKPWLPTTDRVVAFMEALRARGVEVPRVRGRLDDCLVLDFVPGRLALDLVPLDLGTVRAVGSMVRAIHDAAEGLEVPADWEVLLPVDDPDLLCHHDLAAWNLVVDGDRLVVIDWDGAGPSSRLWDLAYAAISFGHLFPDAEPAASAARLGAFVDGYDAGAALRAALPSTLARRSEAMHQLLQDARASGREPWASMHAAGHGEHWRRTTAFIKLHHDRWREAAVRADT